MRGDQAMKVGHLARMARQFDVKRHFNAAM
jgi:hypothetical protein